MKIILMFWITLLFVLAACGQSSPRPTPEPLSMWGFDHTYCTYGIMLENEFVSRNEGCPETAPRVIRDRSDIEEPLATDPVTGWTIFRCNIRTGGGHMSGCEIQRLCAISADGKDMRRLTGACALTPVLISPDGRWLITVSEAPQNRLQCHVNLVKMRFDGSESQLLVGDEWGFCGILSLEWSSDLDGDWVFFQVAQGPPYKLQSSPGYRARVDGGGVEQINMRFVPPTPVLPVP